MSKLTVLAGKCVQPCKIGLERPCYPTCQWREGLVFDDDPTVIDDPSARPSVTSDTEEVTRRVEICHFCRGDAGTECCAERVRWYQMYGHMMPPGVHSPREDDVSGPAPPIAALVLLPRRRQWPRLVAIALVAALIAGLYVLMLGKP